MKTGALAAAIACASAMLVGCGTPTVKYAAYDQAQQQKALEPGSIVFALRASEILLVGDAAKKVDLCEDKNDGSAKLWPRCLDAVKVSVVPTVGSQRYLASPDDGSWLHHTRLAAVTLEDDTGNLDNVAVAYADDTTAFITSVGSGAAAGLTLGGPVGAILGGIAGAAVGTEHAQSVGPRDTAKTSAWHSFVCHQDVPVATDPAGSLDLKAFTAYLEAADKDRLSPAFSYVIGLPPPPDAPKETKGSDTANSKPAPPPDLPNCWHAIPHTSPIRNDARTVLPAPWTGWVYRLILKDVPLSPPGGTVAAGTVADYFKSGGHSTFPYVPCQSAELQLTWITALQNATVMNDVLYRAYPLKLANPAYLRFATLPKGGTIKLGAVCDATVVLGSYAGSTPQTDLAALLKAATDIKAAQPK